MLSPKYSFFQFPVALIVFVLIISSFNTLLSFLIFLPNSSFSLMIVKISRKYFFTNCKPSNTCKNPPSVAFGIKFSKSVTLSNSRFITVSFMLFVFVTINFRKPYIPSFPRKPFQFLAFFILKTIFFILFQILDMI